MQLLTGKRYAADIKLGFLESMAGNDTIRRKLEDAGFTNVMVTGTGASRSASGTWSGPSRDADLPSQVKNVRMMP